MFTGKVPKEKVQHREVMGILRKKARAEPPAVNPPEVTVHVEPPVVNIVIPEKLCSYEFTLDRGKDGRVSKIIARPLDE